MIILNPNIKCVKCKYNLTGVGKEIIKCPNCGMLKARTFYLYLLKSGIPKSMIKDILSKTITKYELMLLEI